MNQKAACCVRTLQRLQRKTVHFKRYFRHLALLQNLLELQNQRRKPLSKSFYSHYPVFHTQNMSAMDSNSKIAGQAFQLDLSQDVVLVENHIIDVATLDGNLEGKQLEKRKRSKPRKKKVSKSGLSDSTLSKASVDPNSDSPSCNKGSPGLEAFIEASSTPTDDMSNSAKSSKSRSQKRNYHSETTPSKGGIPKMNCNEYWPLARVEEGINNGTVVAGTFRISQRNYSNAYITSPGGDGDILIEGFNHRNRAFHGDIVAVEKIEEEGGLKREVHDIARRLALEVGNLQITEENIKKADKKRGRVVRIMEKKHSRKVAGMLKQYKNNAFGFALLSPQDSRLPRLMISLNDCPKDFLTRPQDFENVLFMAEVTDWKRTNGMASGKLIKELGASGEIMPETEGFLAEYSVDDSAFPDDVLACLPGEFPWKIPYEECAKRRDLRHDVIFTIDPATARDLDDALSIKQKEDGNFEVGVHIADVSFFIEEGSALDNAAASRATSVYLVQKVVPMLPRALCENLCSLNPGEDKLTYSVIWTIAPDGKVLEEWFGRSVIRSCTKLSYDHAQQMIETEDPNSLDWTQFPDIGGSCKLTDVYHCVHNLYQLSLQLRKRRFDSGALALNQPKLTFTLDLETGLPNGFGMFLARDSNRLVEEFMLLANMAVAHRLVRSLPEHALLRRHPVPNSKMVEDLLTLCKRCDIGLETGTSKDLNSSLEKLKNSDLPNKEAIYFALVSLCSKPMQLAKYFCAGEIEDVNQYRHYALNVPLYTHFTSPIRRYPDVIVHRMLTAALQQQEVKQGVQELKKVADQCNDKKASAKKVQELSVLLFFNAYIREAGELRESAVIVGMLDSAVDILLLHSGLVKRIYCNSLPLHKWKVSKESKDTMKIYWKDENEAKLQAEENGTSNKQKTNDGEDDGSTIGLEQTLQIFDKIEVILRSEKKDRSSYTVNAYIPRPET